MEASQERLMRSRRWLRPKVLVPAIAGMVVLGAFVLYWFQPQALLLDKRIDEKAPGMMKDEAVPKEDAMEEEGAMMSPSSAFRGLKYDTTGKAILAKQEDGSYLLRLEDFETQNGPDLKVYLSTALADADPSTFDDDFISLGNLNGNIGNQNYSVPGGTDLAKYKSVVIWCRRFSVGFGVAPLAA